MIGSGIAAQQLSPHDIGLQLLENAAATGAGLYTIIQMFGPVSGGHFNPVLSFLDAGFGGISWRDMIAYLPAQIAGCVLGALAANGMFAKAAISISTHHRASPAHLLAEIIATLGLLLVIFSLARSRRGASAPAAVGAYIGAAYFFTQLDQLRQPRDKHRPHVLQHVRRDRPRLGTRFCDRPGARRRSRAPRDPHHLSERHVRRRSDRRAPPPGRRTRRHELTRHRGPSGWRTSMSTVLFVCLHNAGNG